VFIERPWIADYTGSKASSWHAAHEADAYGAENSCCRHIGRNEPRLIATRSRPDFVLEPAAARFSSKKAVVVMQRYYHQWSAGAPRLAFRQSGKKAALQQSGQPILREFGELPGAA